MLRQRLPCLAQELREVGMPLIDIHSQGENSAIADDAKALFFVDAYRKDRILPLRQAYEESYRLLSDLKQGYGSFRKEHEELDGEYLRFQIQEIERYHLKENEIEDLEKESQDLKGLERLQEAFSRLQETGSLAEGNLLDLLSSYLSQLRPLTGTSLAESAERASSAGRDFLSAMADLKEEYESLDADPQRIDEINQRLFSLKGLQRKYGKTTSEILDRLADYRKKLEGLEDFDAECQRREKAIAGQEAECQKKAEALSEERKKSGEALSKAIGSEMADLGLLRDGFLVRFQKTELGPSGYDQATFFVRLNKGLPECELRKAASGGESSRLMLALKSVLNRLSPAPVLVLDEIDTGVSGKAAGLMARKIKSLSQDSQVIVISHLAQVVASSQDAIEVKKSMKGEKTTVLAKRLTRDEKAESIARMISGSEVTEAALQQAKALVKEYR